MECHQEISRRLTEKRGYHALQVKPATGGNDCGRCHSEHNGLNHRLLRWPVAKEKFDHAQAGWKLEGKHARPGCAACHSAKYLTLADRAVLKRNDPGASFTGLETACAACHKDIHGGQLSARCTDCHSQDSWKPAAGFSHEKSRYPLTGLHAKLECDKCHKATVAGTTVPYKGFVMYNYCASCHKDVHGNAFGGDCARCHVTGGWKQILPGNGFDHNKTDYPLLGKHAAVACKECHKTQNFKTHVAFERCLDCHRDQHGGQFLRREDGGDCKACHDELSWKKAKYTVTDHATSAYPLLAKHAEVECAKCHLPKGRETQYRVPFAACTACHQDTHKGEFAGTPHNNRCEACHNAAAWKPALYSVAQHNQTSFALKGAHLAVACSGCHVEQAGKIGYHPEAAKCDACHKTPHGEVKGATHCDSCHSVISWKERGRFDHSQTEFALLGRHGAVDCLACHKPETQAAVRKIAFHGAAKACAGCHADVHGGQFQASSGAPEGREGCERCHTVVSWRPTEFDHGKHSTFKLDGAHDRVPCGLCHNQRRDVDGRAAIVYKPTPRECKACHQ